MMRRFKLLRHLALLSLGALITGSLWVVGSGRAISGAYSRGAAKPASHFLFDDFDYSTGDQMARHGWIIRTAAGWPGLPGAVWRKEGVTFHDDPSPTGNRILRMTSYTDGTGTDTQQTQICHERKYKEGTYAARVRFSDVPVSGPDGDLIVESFYTICPLKAPMDPDYSELDFEYLPHGGWGKTGPTLFVTSWETFSPEPNWKQVNDSNSVGGAKSGWHTLVTQVAGGHVKYFIDGMPIAEHGGKFYPKVPMSINFNLWFIKDGAVKSTGVRSYAEDIDWVYFEQNTVLTPEQIEARVAELRRGSVKFSDTVPAPVPALDSPCDF